VPEDGGHISLYLNVREAHDGQIAGGEDLVALGVVVSLIRVDRTVDFNHQAGAMAVEVDYKAVDYLLPPKVQPFKPPRTEPLPQQKFVRRHFAPEFQRQLDFRVRNPLASHHRFFSHAPRYHSNPLFARCANAARPLLPTRAAGEQVTFLP
jgi:hypothetical protein